MIDLVLTDETIDLGFSKVIKVDIIKIKSKAELNKKLKNNINIILGCDLNREILENKNVDVLLSPEKDRKKDFMHHRNSGLNHILAKIAHKNKIVIGFNFNDALKSGGEKRSRILGRMMQNVRLCRKYKVRMLIASFANDKFERRAPSELISFGQCIGMTPGEAKTALNTDVRKYRESFEGIKLVK